MQAPALGRPIRVGSGGNPKKFFGFVRDIDIRITPLTEWTVTVLRTETVKHDFTDLDPEHFGGV